MDSERRRILKRLTRLREAIESDFNTAAHWNAYVRQSHEEPVEYDPYGDMRRLVTAIDALLANDKGYGPIAPLNFTPSH